MGLEFEHIKAPVRDYLINIRPAEPKILVELRQATQALPGAHMLTSPEQAQFLMSMVKLTQAQRILEIGTFTGYSSLAMALALTDNASIVTCDIDTRATEIAQAFWQKAGIDHKIRLKLEPAMDVFTDYANNPPSQLFDMVFIDANIRHYHEYYQSSLNLIRRGGLIIIDNMLWHGRVANFAEEDPRTMAIRALNSQLQTDARIMYNLLPIGDGFGMAIKQ